MMQYLRATAQPSRTRGVSYLTGQCAMMSCRLRLHPPAHNGEGVAGRCAAAANVMRELPDRARSTAANATRAA